MKAIILCIDKTQKLFFLKNPISKNKKQKNKQNVIFQLHHIRFTIWEQFLQFKACKSVNIDAIGVEVAPQVKLSGFRTKGHFTVKSGKMHF